MNILTKIMNNAPTDLKTLKKTAAMLEARRPVLAAALDEAVASEGKSGDALTKARIALAEGTGDTAALLKASDEHGRRIVHRTEIERAVAMVEEDYATVASEIEAVEREIERQRQQKRADELQALCDELLDAQAQAIAALWRPLKERAAIMNEIKTTLPMAVVPTGAIGLEVAARAAKLIEVDEFEETPSTGSDHLRDLILHWTIRSVALQTPNAIRSAVLLGITA